MYFAHNSGQPRPGRRSDCPLKLLAAQPRFADSNRYNICGGRSSTGTDEPSRITGMTEQDRQISEIVARERSRLRNFIRRRVPDPSDAEDIVQEVFYELVEANRLLVPIEHVTGWLFRVARHQITDLFRKKKPERFSDAAFEDKDGELLQLED